MSARLESLAVEKRSLLDRVALQRLRLRRDGRALRSALPWNRFGAVAAARTSLPRLAAGVALALVARRMGPLGMLAAFIVSRLLRRRA